MSRMLLIDDFRDFNVDRVARTYEEGITALKEEEWDVLYLDHDLGQSDGKDGYGIACFLERNPQYRPKKIVLVTANPVGRENIERCLSNFYEKAANSWNRVSHDPAGAKIKGGKSD